MLYNNITTPGSIRTELEIDDPGQGGIPEGQPEPIVDNTPSVPAVSDPTAEPFFVYDRGKEPQTFNTKEDMADAFHNGTLRHSDYTKKTQATAKEWEKINSAQAKYDAEYTSFLTEREKQKKISDWLNALPPAKRQELENGFRGDRAVSDPAYREMSEKLTALEEDKKREKKERDDNEKLQKRRTSEATANDFLLKRYPDYDAKQIDEALNKFREIPESEQMTGLRELLYFSGKGRGSKVLTPPHQGGNAFGNLPTPKGQFKSLDEAAEKAKKDLGV